MATIACSKAAMHSVSSTRVQMSATRNSRVGNLGCGRMSHQILVGSSIDPVSSRMSMKRSYSLHEPKSGGSPVRGRFSKTIERYDFRPVSRPCQKGELVDNARMCGMK